MEGVSTLRGMATVSFFADDVVAAKRWYAELLGMEPYFARPDASNPQYVEFRIGDYQAELGIIDSRFSPQGPNTAACGAVLYWHVDDVDAVLARVLSMGAKVHQERIERGPGFVTASVIDPFGNILGLMHNQHYLDILESATA